MKKAFFYAIFLSVLIVLILISCEKPSKSPPEITLIGPEEIDHVLNSPYIDQGATAYDDDEGSISSKIIVNGSVNKDSIGDYKLVYSIVDDAGNADTVTRTIRVYNQSEHLAGNYLVTQTLPWPNGSVTNNIIKTIKVSPDTNRQILLTNFGKATNATVYINVDLSTNTLSIPIQTSGNYTFQSLASPLSTIGTGTPIVINIYAKQTILSTETEFQETFTKQ